jgi:NitT/TauT family transport system substrate-binding protein
MVQVQADITQMAARKFLLVFSLIFSLLFAITAPANAKSKIACAPSKSDAKFIGKLRIAGQVTQVPSVKWGIDNGCFKKYGLSIESSVVATSQIGTAGLVGGSFDIVITTPTNLVLANANEGFGGVIVAPRHGYTPEELIRAKLEPLFPGEILLQTALISRNGSGIRADKWADLEGKKIALQSFLSADHAGIAIAMRKAGADYKKTEFVTLTSQQMVDALKRGDIDAGVIQDPFATQAILAGGRVIGYPNAYYAQSGYLGDSGVAVAYLSNVQTVKKNLKAMRAFQKATLVINKLLNQPENDASFRKTYMDVTGVNAAAAAKVKLPTMIERNLVPADISYIPARLFEIGFIRERIKSAPVIFK